MRQINKRNILVASIFLILIGGFSLFFLIPTKGEKEVAEKQSIYEMKKAAHTEYVEAMTQIGIATDVNTTIQVIHKSQEILDELDDDAGLGKYYDEVEEGNEYLDALKTTASKNLVEAIIALYDANVSPSQFDSIEYIIESKHIPQTSKAILKSLMANAYENRDVTIGITREKAMLTKWGKPEDVNRRTTADHVSEQWVYPNNKYLYFEDGILIAISE